MSFLQRKAFGERVFRTVRKNTISGWRRTFRSPSTLRGRFPTCARGADAAHVAIATRIGKGLHKKGLTTLWGFDFFGMMTASTLRKLDRSKAEILELLRTEGNSFARGCTLSRSFCGDGDRADTENHRIRDLRGCLALRHMRSPSRPTDVEIDANWVSAASDSSVQRRVPHIARRRRLSGTPFLRVTVQPVLRLTPGCSSSCSLPGWSR